MQRQRPVSRRPQARRQLNATFGFKRREEDTTTNTKMKIPKREDDMFPFGGHVVNRPTMIKLNISLLCGLIGLVIGFLLFGPAKNIITPTIGGICAMYGYLILGNQILKKRKERLRPPIQAL